MISCLWRYPSRERENTVGGDRRLKLPWPVSAGHGGSLETGCAGEAEQPRFCFRFLGSGTPGAEAFVLREGAVPVSLSPLFVGRTHSPPPGAQVPALPRCYPRADGPDTAGPAELPVSFPTSADQRRLGVSPAGLARSPRGLLVARLAGAQLLSAYWLVGLQGDAAFSGKV